MINKEYYYDEDGVRRRKKGVAELQDIDVGEISLVDSPATRKKFMIVKGDEREMMEELRGWEDISKKEITVIKEIIKILNPYDLVNDLKRAKGVLTKYFEEGEVKKYNERCEFTTAQRQIFGYCEDDLDFINENIEVEKSDPNDKWPSLTRRFSLNKRQLEGIYEERNVEVGAI